MPGKGELAVARVRMQTEYLLKPECVEILEARGNGEGPLPGDYDDRAAQETGLVDKLFQEDRRATNAGVALQAGIRGLFEAPRGSLDRLAPPPAPREWSYRFVSEAEVLELNNSRKVKREQTEDFHERAAKLAKQMRGKFINVDNKTNSRASSAREEALRQETPAARRLREQTMDEEAKQWWAKKMVDAHRQLHRQLSIRLRRTIVDVDAGADVALEVPAAETQAMVVAGGDGGPSGPQGAHLEEALEALMRDEARGDAGGPGEDA